MYLKTFQYGLSIALAGLACTAGAVGPNGTSGTSPTIQTPVVPFQYVPSERWKDPDGANKIERQGEALRIAELYTDGKYAEVGTDGLVLLTTEKVDEQLRLYIANSLAWTNRLKEAGQLYRVLLESKYKASAKLGLANLNRWQGRDHLALPLYQEILAGDPENKDALEGLRLANRETASRTTVIAGGSHDSGQIQTRVLRLNHRWRDANLANIWEVETSLLKAHDLSTEARRQDFTVRYKALETFLKPRLEMSSDGYNVFGSAGIELGSLPVLIDVGRVNWGLVANTPKALALHLVADRIAVQTTAVLAAGNLSARADLSKISDGNTITTSALRFTPSWRPLGTHFKPMLALETRNAKAYTGNYWAPSDGYGSASAGLMAEWGGADWNFSASAQAGVRVFGEAGNSWSVSSGGKRWLTNDWAVGMNLWAMASKRNSQPYRAQSLFVTVEKLWH
jgi:tetratricopeptide (TPR) repeat protein